MEIGLMTALKGLSAIGGAVATIGGVAASQNQAAAAQQKADIEGRWAERRAGEERASAQRGAFEEKRKAGLAQSRLMAVAGASGTSPADQSVMDLWGDIEKEGDLNAANVTAGGEQRAGGLKYGADLNRWSADANARIAKASATPTLIGGLLSNAGQFGREYFGSRMAARYGQGEVGTSSGATGYGYR